MELSIEPETDLILGDQPLARRIFLSPPYPQTIQRRAAGLYRARSPAPRQHTRRFQSHWRPRGYLRTAFNESMGQFSPDTRWVAFQSDESGRNEVYIDAFPEPRARYGFQRGEACFRNGVPAGASCSTCVPVPIPCWPTPVGIRPTRKVSFQSTRRCFITGPCCKID